MENFSDYFIENKHNEIKNKEYSFHHVRFNNILEEINKHNDEMAMEIKKKLNSVDYTSLNNIVEKEINKEKNNDREINVNKETENENKKNIEKLLSKYKQNNVFNITIDKNNNMYIIKCSNDKITQKIKFDNLLLHLYNDKNISKCENIELYKQNRKFSEIKISEIKFSEIPYIYIDDTNKKNILFYIKDINKLDDIYINKINPIINIQISYVKDYEIKYQLNILKYLFANKNKMKYLIYYLIYYTNNVEIIETKENQNIIIDFIISLYHFKSAEFIDDNTLELLNAIIKIHEYKKEIFSDEINKLYKLIIHCSLHNRIIKCKNSEVKISNFINKILSNKNSYYDDKVIKEIKTNNNICLETAIKIYDNLCPMLKNMICNILIIPNDNSELIKKFIYYIVL